MPARKLMLMVAAVLAVSGLGFTAQAEEAARAKQAPKPAKTQDAALELNQAPVAKEKAASGKGAPRPSGGTAKRGEACKVDADCDQSSSDMRCGKSKCEYDMSRAHPAT